MGTTVERRLESGRLATRRCKRRKLGHGWGWGGHWKAQDLTDAFAQRPQLFVVEVGISLNARARGKGVCQKTVLAVEGIPISVLCKRPSERKGISRQHLALFKCKILKATAAPPEQRPRPWEEVTAAPTPLEVGKVSPVGAATRDCGAGTGADGSAVPSILSLPWPAQPWSSHPRHQTG